MGKQHPPKGSVHRKNHHSNAKRPKTGRSTRLQGMKI